MLNIASSAVDLGVEDRGIESNFASSAVDREVESNLASSAVDRVVE
jgi:hypothetical protein